MVNPCVHMHHCLPELSFKGDENLSSLSHLNETLMPCCESVIMLAVPEESVSLSTNTMGTAIAGRTYDVFCIATVQDGIQSTPIFTWLDSDGDVVVNGNDVTVGPSTANSLPLEFSILRVQHSGTYTCSVTLFSLPLQTPLTTTTSISFSVERKS